MQSTAPAMSLLGKGRGEMGKCRKRQDRRPGHLHLLEDQGRSPLSGRREAVSYLLKNHRSLLSCGLGSSPPQGTSAGNSTPSVP